MVEFASKLMRENLMLSRDITYEEIIGKGKEQCNEQPEKSNQKLGVH
jgi:hypothetical protein